MGSLLEELKAAKEKEKLDFINEREEKSFNYWFEHNEEIRNYLGDKTSEEIKGLLRLGYHFGFNNCFEFYSDFLKNKDYTPAPAEIIDYTK